MSEPPQDPEPPEKEYDPYKEIPKEKRLFDESVKTYLMKFGVRCIQDLNDEPKYIADKYYRVPEKDPSGGGYLPDFKTIFQKPEEPSEEDQPTEPGDSANKPKPNDDLEIFSLNRNCDTEPISEFITYQKVNIIESINKYGEIPGYAEFFNILDDIPTMEEYEIFITDKKEVKAIKDLGEEIGEDTIFKIFSLAQSEADKSNMSVDVAEVSSEVESPQDEEEEPTITEEPATTEEPAEEGIEDGETESEIWVEDDDEWLTMKEAVFYEIYGIEFTLIKDTTIVFRIKNILFDFSELLSWQIDIKPEVETDDERS